MAATKFALPQEENECSSWQHELSFSLLIISILTCQKWKVKEVSTYIFLLTKDIEPFFTCFSDTKVPFFDKSLFRLIPHFLQGCLIYF